MKVLQYTCYLVLVDVIVMALGYDIFLFLANILIGWEGSGSISHLPTNRPLIIAHRGSCGMLPEHTVEAYKLAIAQGADIIECDLAITKDLHLICSHDAFLNITTNVAAHQEFKDRIRTYVIEGKTITDYFTVDFTLKELKTLRTIQRFPFRDQSHNGEFPIATFAEYLQVARNATPKVGIYPETKNPRFFNDVMKQRGFPQTMEDMLIEMLRSSGYNKHTDPCFIQSFHPESLFYISSLTELPLVLLTKFKLSNQNMTKFAAIGYAIGADKKLIVEVNQQNKIAHRTDFVERAHSHGLKVHSWVSRNEYMYLPFDYGQDPYREYDDLTALGVDGLFTDFAWSLANYMKHHD